MELQSAQSRGLGAGAKMPEAMWRVGRLRLKTDLEKKRWGCGWKSPSELPNLTDEGLSDTEAESLCKG